MTMKWCICEGQGTCYGCAIEQTVRQEFGTQGTAFVRSRLAAEMEPTAWAVLSTHSGDEREIDLFEGRKEAEKHAERNGGVVVPLVTANDGIEAPSRLLAKVASNERLGFTINNYEKESRNG